MGTQSELPGCPCTSCTPSSCGTRAASGGNRGQLTRPPVHQFRKGIRIWQAPALSATRTPQGALSCWAAQAGLDLVLPPRRLPYTWIAGDLVCGQEAAARLLGPGPLLLSAEGLSKQQADGR